MISSTRKYGIPVYRSIFIREFDKGRLKRRLRLRRRLRRRLRLRRKINDEVSDISIDGHTGSGPGRMHWYAIYQVN
jgi:hypothetical protein